MNSTENKRYDLPPTTSDPATLEQYRRGLCQEADGLKRQLDGKRQQIKAIDEQLKKGSGG